MKENKSSTIPLKRNYSKVREFRSLHKTIMSDEYYDG